MTVGEAVLAKSNSQRRMQLWAINSQIIKLLIPELGGGVQA